MDTIFNIFGSHEAVRPPTINTFNNVGHASKELIPGKPGTTNGFNKGKKVLGDVGNKLKACNSKQEIKLDVTLKKPLQEISLSRANQENKGSKCMDVPKNITQEKQKSSSQCQLITPVKDLASWPEVETQGPSFWSDDDSATLWSECERPTVDDFLNSVNIWDAKNKIALDPPSSPLPVDISDDLDFCFDLPKCSPRPVFEEVVVPYPWEL